MEQYIFVMRDMKRVKSCWGVNISIGRYISLGNTSNEAVLVYALLDVPLAKIRLIICMTYFR